MARLADIPIDALRSELESFDGHRPTQRLLAAIIYKSGPSVPQIADWLDVREATVYAWFDRLEDADDVGDAVLDRPRSGRPPKLPPEEREAVLRQLSAPPSAAGLDAAEWSVQMARDYLADEYGVKYSPRHVRRLLREADSIGNR